MTNDSIQVDIKSTYTTEEVTAIANRALNAGRELWTQRADKSWNQLKLDWIKENL